MIWGIQYSFEVGRKQGFKVQLGRGRGAGSSVRCQENNGQRIQREHTTVRMRLLLLGVERDRFKIGDEPER